MTFTRPRVRFAPSPTGDLHVGNARTALFNWLYAKHYGGDFILRIEDTDSLRTTAAFEAGIRADLEWLSIDWDEGPGRGGAHGPYHQSERREVYTRFLDKLIGTGRVYPCYCTEEELEAERAELVFRKMTPRYMGRCRNLSAEDRKSLDADGRRPSYRFAVGTGQIVFQDLIRGDMKFDAEAMGDFIVVRSNGIPAYNFAVVVDDHLMRISHVIRGEDHLSNTALQLLIYQALGLTPPRFAHHALILGKSRHMNIVISNDSLPMSDESFEEKQRDYSQAGRLVARWLWCSVSCSEIVVRVLQGCQNFLPWRNGHEPRECTPEP